MAFDSVTDKTVPHRLELLGEPLVLWWDHESKVWATMSDACPHRLAPLSEGRVDEDGQIECPYHGWSFTSEGECTKIPQAASAPDGLLSRCRGTSFATVEKQGLIWVWATPLNFGASSDATVLPDESLIPTCEAMDDDRFVWIDVSRDMPYSADMLLENVLDSSHVPFTHHQTISKRENAVPLRLRLTEPVSAQGFVGEQAQAPPLPSAGVSGRAPQGAGAQTERTTLYVAPTYMHHKIRTAPAGSGDDFDKGFETWTVAYATPTGPGRCRLLARFPFRFPSPEPKQGVVANLLPSINFPKAFFKRVPDWIQHMGQLTVLDDDNIFLPLQERRVNDKGGWRANYVMPTSADTYVSAYRRWYDAAGPPPHAAHASDHLHAAPLDKEKLLDRLSQHTAHCKSCSGALANAKRVNSVTKVLLIALATSLPWILSSSSMAVLLAAPRFTSAVATRTSLLAAAAELLVSLRPLLGISVMAVAVGAARKFALTVEQRLTTGLPEYPPPRNRPAKGKGKELRTVEQGRRS